MSKHLLVAAIDFGTTYSSWAFSFKHEYDSDPTSVSAKQWQGHESQKELLDSVRRNLCPVSYFMVHGPITNTRVSHMKTMCRAIAQRQGPTCVLIMPDGKTLHSFGFRAETKYSELIEEEKHNDWYFFRRFKMKLWKQKLIRNSELEDENGRKLLARKVFALAIKFLKDDLWDVANDRIADAVLQKEIHWVLTVPAIWDDAAKQFMREAAEEAGIESGMLSIALEPEAASLFCRHLPVERSGNQLSLGSLRAGKQYLVLDAGGGTVDITVHEVTPSGDVKELYKASGGAWGGTKVDDSFEEFLVCLTDKTVVNKFKEDHLDDYLDLLRRFEVKKRSIDPDMDSKVVMSMPLAFFTTVKELLNKDFKEIVDHSSYSKQVSLSGDKLKMDPAVAQNFFKESTESTIEHVKDVLRKPKNGGVEAILMVGGFSESKMLNKAVKQAFPELKMIIPNEAGLAVLKGAVVFGHEPRGITERISKYTYGIQSNDLFDSSKHPESAKFTDTVGVDRCKDYFDKHVIAGQSLEVGKAQSEKIYVTKPTHGSHLTIEVFATKRKTPVLTTDPGCKKVGQYSIPMAGTGAGRKVLTRMIFGGTEIDVECTEKATGKVSHIPINFLL